MSFVNLNRARISRFPAQRDDRGGALAGFLIGGIGALVLVVQAQIAASDDSTQSPASKAEQAQAKTKADDLPDDVKGQRLGLQEIARRYQANRDACKFGKCRLWFHANEAETMQDVQAGKWKAPPLQEPREETIFFREGALVWKSKIGQHNFVRNGRFALRQSENQVIVYPPEFDWENLHPFDRTMDMSMDHSNPATVMARAESRNYEGMHLSLQETVLQDGKESVMFRHRGVTQTYDADFEIDRQRGCLPIRTAYFMKRSRERPSPELHAQRFVLETHREGNAYIPTHVMLIIYSKTRQGNPYFAVQEYKVLDLDLAHPPSAEEMTVELPKMAKFRIALNPGSDKTLFADADGDTVTVSVDDIEKIYRQLEAATTEKK